MLSGDDRLREYIVWVPVLGAEEPDVPRVTRQKGARDPRVQNYWDGAGVLVRGYDRALSLGEDAWDIYLIYGPSARWQGSAPPQPDFWMHQLGEPAAPRVPRDKAPYLDAAVFAQKVRDLQPAL